MKLFCRAIFAGALLLIFGAARAADSADVLVTASRYSESRSDTFWSTDVLTRDEIDARQTFSLPDLLTGLAGVQFDNAGGMGKATSLFLRGTNSDHTLLLVDGVRVGSATLGAPPLELIPVGEIDHIEVVRGPRSTLYGSDAMGGVIQIFTRGAGAPGVSGSAEASGGSYDTFRESASFRATGEQLWFSANGTLLHSAGFNACNGSLSPPAGCFAVEPDRDGFHSTSGTFAAGTHFAEGWSAELRTLLTSGRSDYDGSFANVTDFAERVESLLVDGKLSDSWTLHLTAGHNVDDEKDLLAAVPQDRFVTSRNSASAQLEGTFNNALRLVSGADWLDDHVDSTTPYDVTTRATTGVFTELHATQGAWSELAGARLEDNDQFGDHVTGNVGLAWKAESWLRLTATWGTAFHAPTFNDLYYPGFSNPQLQPEESRSTELAAEGLWQSLHWSVHAYQTDIGNLISFDPVTFTPQNIATARIQGVELAGDWKHGPWSLSGQLTLLDPRDRTAGDGDTLLPRRARQSAALDVRRAMGRFNFAAIGHWQGRRFDDAANTVPLGGYFTLDLLSEWNLRPEWSLKARLANALGRSYETEAYYNQPGREFDLTIAYRFAPPH